MKKSALLCKGLNKSESHKDGNIMLPTLLSQRHKGSILVWLSDKWSTTTTTEYHGANEKNGGVQSDAFFLNLGVKYQSKKWNVELLLSNITNQENYEVTTINDTYTYRTITPLRPFEVLLTFTLKK